MRKPLGRTLLALGPLLAANSLLGPLALEVIRYRFSDSLLAQGVGLDAVSLVVVAPLAVVAGVLTLRRRPLGPVLGLGIGAYVAYMSVQYVVGPEYLGVPGNNERFVPFHLGLLVLGLVTTAGAWTVARRTPLPPASERGARRWAGVLLGLGALLLLRHLPALVQLAAGDPSLPEYRENPTSFLLVATLDLGVFLPLAVAAGLALWRNHAWARTGLHLVTGWFALVGLAVAAMAAAMWLQGDPAMSRVQLAAFAVTALVLVGLEGRLLRFLGRDSGAGGSSPGGDGSPSDDGPSSDGSPPDEESPAEDPTSFGDGNDRGPVVG